MTYLPEGLVGDEVGLVGDDGLVGEPDGLVGDPDGLVGEPDGLVGEPDGLVGLVGDDGLCYYLDLLVQFQCLFDLSLFLVLFQ